jgi:hypothetical protein
MIKLRNSSVNLKVRDHLEDLGVDESIILERISEKQDGKVWKEFNWLNIGSNGGLL